MVVSRLGLRDGERPVQSALSLSQPSGGRCEDRFPISDIDLETMVCPELVDRGASAAQRCAKSRGVAVLVMSLAEA